MILNNYPLNCHKKNTTDKKSIKNQQSFSGK